MSDKLYNIEPKEFKVLERHEVGNSITYVLEPITKPTECPNCHDTNFIQHGVKTRKVRDLNEFGKLVGLIVNGHRYRVDNWRAEIFNYFDYRFTNAITESLNHVSKETAAKGRGYNFDVLRAKLLYRNEAAQPAKFAFIEEVDVVNSKHIKPFNSSNIPIDNVIVVSAGTHIGKLHDLLEQDKIFSPTDGKHRVKFVDGETPHFKRYKGDTPNENRVN